MIKSCKYCKSESMNEEMKTFRDGTKHLALFCTKCGKFNGYKAQNKPKGPPTEEHAMHFKITWKPYEGYELQNVDDKYLDELLRYTKSEYLERVYQVEKERRHRILSELK